MIGSNKERGSVNLVCYVKNPKEAKNCEKYKMMRKLNTRFNNELYQSFCWIITNEELAKRLGMSTSKEGTLLHTHPIDMGDIYTLRIIDEGSEAAGKISKIDGYTLCTERLFSNKEALDNSIESFNKIASLVYGRPILCGDEFQYTQLQSTVLVPPTLAPELQPPRGVGRPGKGQCEGNLQGAGRTEEGGAVEGGGEVCEHVVCGGHEKSKSLSNVVPAETVCEPR